MQILTLKHKQLCRRSHIPCIITVEIHYEQYFNFFILKKVELSKCVKLKYTYFNVIITYKYAFKWVQVVILKRHLGHLSPTVINVAFLY
jgi:hypothetical protein